MHTCDRAQRARTSSEHKQFTSLCRKKPRRGSSEEVPGRFRAWSRSYPRTSVAVASISFTLRRSLVSLSMPTACGRGDVVRQSKKREVGMRLMRHAKGPSGVVFSEAYPVEGHASSMCCGQATLRAGARL